MLAFDSVGEMGERIAKACDDKLMRQLEWLVSRGILIIEKSEGKFLQQAEDGKISYHQEIELKVKDKEYIEKLEARAKDEQKLVNLLTNRLSESETRLDEAINIIRVAQTNTVYDLAKEFIEGLENGVSSEFPEILESDWCGEFKPIEGEK